MTSRWPPWFGFLAIVLTACAWVLGHAFLVDSNTGRVCAVVDADIPEEQRMPVFLFETAFDGYVWNRHAERLGQDGRWRLRWTDVDNAPAGREVHWNSAFAWYLRGLGELHSRTTGATLRNSIFRMSIWANPLLLVAALLTFLVLAARRFGPLSGSAIAIGMVSMQTFYDGFTPGYPDHHGIIALALLGMVFGIAGAGGGWVQAAGGNAFGLPTSSAQARHWMIFSAVCGAAGLWFSAVSAAMLLLAVAIGALVAAAVGGHASRQERLATGSPSNRKANASDRHGGRAFGEPIFQHADAVFHPLLWRTWGTVGAGASLLFYLLEYFPGHMRLRLEVNHPLYALAWMGGGYGLAALTEWLAGDRAARFPWRRLGWPVLAAAALPLAVLGGGESVYTLRNAFQLRIHAHLEEFQPLARLIAARQSSWSAAVGGVPFLLALTAGMLLARRVTRGMAAVLAALFTTALLMTALQLYQARWGLLAEVAHIALASALIPLTWRLVPARNTWRIPGALGLLGLALVFVLPAVTNKLPPAWAQFQQGERPAVDYRQAIALLHRQIARIIRDDAGGRPVVVLSSPNSSCLLAGFGGFRTVGTFYWENTEGLIAAAGLLTARSDRDALDRMRARGISHVVLMDWGNFVAPFLDALGTSGTTAIPDTFAYRVLINGTVPIGTRRIPFPPTDSPHELARQLQQQVVLLKIEGNIR